MENSDNKLSAEDAFTKQSKVFDAIYSGNPIIEYKRGRVREQVLKLVPNPSSILELNSGTGEDAIFFADKGFHVHATDISPGMQNTLVEKVNRRGLGHLLSHELISFTDLSLLKTKGPFDLIFSNFAGLNCTPELNKVLENFPKLLKPGGYIVLVIMPPFCLWEVLSAFKGHFNTAFRRFFRPKGAKAHIEGIYFKCWYYNPSYVLRYLKEEFTLLDLEGLCSLVPPSYLEKIPKHFPKLYTQLKHLESRYKSRWPWKYIGDYYIISLKKNS